MRTVYALYDPRDPDVMRYAGVAADPDARLKTHIYDGRLYGTSCYWSARCKWLNSLILEQVLPGMKILEEEVEEDIAGEREKYWTPSSRRTAARW